MSTNYARAKYQEIYDVNTKSNEVSVIGIHTPVGAKPRQMLSGFFTQFRKYKYSGCSVIATPSARLPLSLAQISVEAGTSGINPKDVWNPILVRGCHGDNLNNALNSIYKGTFHSEGSSVGKDDFADTVIPYDITWEQMYYRMLQDPSFKKFSMSSGIKLTGLHPMVYNVASNHQILPNESHADVGELEWMTTETKTGTTSGYVLSPNTGAHVTTGTTSESPADAPIQLMTNRLQKLGWMDTRQLINNPGSRSPSYTVLPKIFMSCIILPMAKSAETVTSMRFIVTHYFEFKEFNTSLTLAGASEYYDWLTNVSEKSSNDTIDTNGSSGSVEIVSDGVF